MNTYVSITSNTFIPLQNTFLPPKTIKTPQKRQKHDRLLMVLPKNVDFDPKHPQNRVQNAPKSGGVNLGGEGGYIGY